MPFVVRLLRARDLLNLELELANLKLDASDLALPRLRREHAGPSTIVVRVPPQHIAEQAFTEGGQQSLPPHQAFLSCASRLAFQLPDGDLDIPFHVEAILTALKGLALAADLPGGAPATVLDFPDGLLLVPDTGTTLHHHVAPVVSTHVQPNRTELWHTRLVVGNPGAPGRLRFRALENEHDVERFPESLTSLTKRHRDDIVRHSSRDPGNRHVIAATEFLLTPLGASAQLTGIWPVVPDSNGSLVAWDHETRLGRDTRVRTVEQGFLFPWRHRASLVTITERKITSGSTGSLAELIQRTFLTPQDTDVSYADLDSAYTFGGREMPFARVHLALPASGELSVQGGVTFIDAVLVDRIDQTIACRLPALFVRMADALNPQVLDELRRAFEVHSVLDCGNERVCLARDNGGRTDTTLNLERMQIGIQLQEFAQPILPPFLPWLTRADVRVPAVEHLLGTTSGGVGRSTTIKIHERYLRHGFTDENVGHLFARFTPELPTLSIPAERAGGLAAPAFKGFNGLSRVNGPKVEQDDIDAQALVGDARLFGMIALKDLLPPIIRAGDDSLAGIAPEELFARLDTPGVFLTQPVMTTVRAGSRIETRFLWKPKMRNQLPAPLQGRDGVALMLKGALSKSIDSSARDTFTVEGKLSNFDLEFAGLLTIGFDAVEFASGSGRKMDVKVHVRAGGLVFQGKLAFVRALQSALPLQLFGGGALVEPLPDGVKVGYAIPIPAVPLGAFNLQNIALGISVSLPFTGGRPAAMRFALSERRHPFLVSVSIFGGTGFFALEVRTDKTLQIEAAIEFGGVVAFNIFIVRGSVYAFVGIFVSVKSDGGVLIEGHLRLGGEVEVLSIVSVSIEVYIALEYDSERNVLAGTGRITVGVKVLFFSESFSFTVRKEIRGFGEAPSEGPGGGGVIALEPAPTAGRPRAAHVTDAEQWNRYCAAFA